MACSLCPSSSALFVTTRPGRTPATASQSFAELNGRLVQCVYFGRPAEQSHPHLSNRRDLVGYRIGWERGGLPERREVECCVRRRHRYPQSAWKLLGAGAVGSQVLTGIPVVSRLRRDSVLRSVSRVWPFEVLVPDFRAGDSVMVQVEIWSSLIEVPELARNVKDRTEVIRLAMRLREEDRGGTLGALFNAARVSKASVEGGWILGVTA